MKSIIQRSVSGIIYLAVIIGSLFLGKFAYAVVFLLIGIAALFEFYRMAEASGGYPFALSGFVSGGLMFVLSFLSSSGMLDPSLWWLILPFVTGIFMVSLYSDKPDLFKNLGITFLGLVYIFIPLSTMNLLVFPESTGFVYTHRIVLGILTLVWINDTGAFLVGITVGRHKLFPRISPKKSWEGAIGGAIFTLLAAWWLNSLMGMLGRADWLILALIVSVFGVLGDLTESLFKRSVDLKDSGSIIPGHGGLLDRIDSVLFVMPIALTYLIVAGL